MLLPSTSDLICGKRRLRARRMRLKTAFGTMRACEHPSTRCSLTRSMLFAALLLLMKCRSGERHLGVLLSASPRSPSPRHNQDRLGAIRRQCWTARRILVRASLWPRLGSILTVTNTVSPNPTRSRCRIAREVSMQGPRRDIPFLVRRRDVGQRLDHRLLDPRIVEVRRAVRCHDAITAIGDQEVVE